MEAQVITWDVFNRLIDRVHGFSVARLVQMPERASSYQNDLSSMISLIAKYTGNETPEGDGWRFMDINKPDGRAFIPCERTFIKITTNEDGKELAEQVDRGYVCVDDERKYVTMSFDGLVIWGAAKVVCCPDVNTFFIIPDEDTYKYSPQLNPSLVLQLSNPMCNMDVRMVLDRKNDENGNTVLSFNLTI